MVMVGEDGSRRVDNFQGPTYLAITEEEGKGVWVCVCSLNYWSERTDVWCLPAACYIPQGLLLSWLPWPGFPSSSSSSNHRHHTVPPHPHNPQASSFSLPQTSYFNNCSSSFQLLSNEYHIMTSLSHPHMRGMVEPPNLSSPSSYRTWIHGKSRAKGV